MQADEGKRVRIGYICRLDDGTIYDFADKDTLEFVVGEGSSLPSLEKGVVGMSPGEHRRIRVPVTEAHEHIYTPEEATNEPGFSAGFGSGGYEFGPGGDGDVVTPSFPRVKAIVRKPSVGSDLFFDVEMLSVEDADVELEKY